MFVLISIIVIISVIIPVIIPISIVLPLLLVVLVMLVRLSRSISYMGSAWPSWSSVAALRARAALAVSPVMLWIHYCPKKFSHKVN